MTLQELITDLKASGANENTLRLAMNCYELGQKDEQARCCKIIHGMAGSDNVAQRTVDAIKRGQQ